MGKEFLEQDNLLCTVCGVVIGTITQESILPHLVELKKHIPYDLIPLLDTHADSRTMVQKEICPAPLFTAPLFKTVKYWKQSKITKQENE